jgi:N-acetylglucosaminyl-diphospho-decaprenol L-rhamnosyltransferase
MINSNDINTVKLSNSITISIISHGHSDFLNNLLLDISSFELINKIFIIVTINLESEFFDPTFWPSLNIFVIRNKTPKGFGANHNQAFLYCKSEWFVILNPDIRFPSDILKQMTSHVANFRLVGAVSPTVLTPKGDIEDHVRKNLTPLSILRRAFGYRFELIDTSNPASIDSDFYWFAGMFMMFPASSFRGVGGFFEDLFLYCEDYDICARLYLQGYKLIVLPSVNIVHSARRDSHRSVSFLRLHLISLLKIWTSITYWRLLFSLYIRKAPKV